MALANLTLVHDAARAQPDWLNGRTTVHKIVVGLTEPRGCIVGLLEEMGRTRGTLRSLNVKPVEGGAFEAVIHTTALTTDEAQALVGRFRRHPHVNCAAIEHMLIS